MKTKLLFSIASAATLAANAPIAAAGNPCDQVTAGAFVSCNRGAVSDFWLARAKCANLPSPTERANCLAASLVELDAAFGECRAFRDARTVLCADLGGGYYAPVIDPANFVAVIDNPRLPLLPGTTRIYEKTEDGEVERIEVATLRETREILGVTCTTVHDVVFVDGEIIEDTLDWFAQDVQGNVWYFGEISRNFEDGQLSDLAGSWEAGVDGALPGIVMWGSPQAGTVYRQEFLLREAEDCALVLRLSASASVPYGNFTDCLVTEDFTPLDPGAIEHKYYAAGIGLVLETKPGEAARLELIDIRVE